jgi:hypothetical protein
VKPFGVSNILANDFVKNQNDVVEVDNYKGGYDPILKRDSKLTNKERGEIFSQRIMDMKKEQEKEESISTKRKKKNKKTQKKKSWNTRRWKLVVMIQNTQSMKHKDLYLVITKKL